MAIEYLVPVFENFNICPFRFVAGIPYGITRGKYTHKSEEFHLKALDTRVTEPDRSHNNISVPCYVYQLAWGTSQRRWSDTLFFLIDI